MQIKDGVIHRNDMNKDAMGGSELITHAIAERVSPEALNGVQIIVSRLRDQLDTTKHRVYHCHDLPQDPESKHLANGGWEKFHKLVFVSHWQRQAYINHFGIPWHKTIVMRNAIDPIQVDLGKKLVQKDEINIVYHTTPHRGLELLVPAFQALRQKYDNINLHVYSSFNVYGWGERDAHFKTVFEEIEKPDNGMYLYDTLDNASMKQRLVDMDIFAYPSIWPETSCISLIEAMSAGCLCVHSDYGGIHETASNWTYMYDFDERQHHHIQSFVDMMDNAITLYKDMPEGLVNRLKGQKSFMDIYYSWDVRAAEWEGFLTALKDMPLELKQRGVKVQPFKYNTG